MDWRREMAWRRLDEHGEERCAFLCAGGACAVEGIGAIAINGSGMIYEYRIEYDDTWNPRKLEAVSRLGTDEFRMVLEQREPGVWYRDGLRVEQFDGCTDIDLGFSASTNTATIRRLALEKGEEAGSRAVLVNEPELTLELLEQSYRRVGKTTYEYVAGSFRSYIEVDEELVVLDYAGKFSAALEPAGVSAGD